MTNPHPNENGLVHSYPTSAKSVITPLNRNQTKSEKKSTTSSSKANINDDDDEYGDFDEESPTGAASDSSKFAENLSNFDDAEDEDDEGLLV